MTAAYAMSTRELSMDWRNGLVKFGSKGVPVPAGTIVKLPDGLEGERFTAEFANESDFVLLDERTGRELLDAQARQRAAYNGEALRVRAEREAAERAELERQERAAALVALAMQAVEKPAEIE